MSNCCGVCGPPCSRVSTPTHGQLVSLTGPWTLPSNTSTRNSPMLTQRCIYCLSPHCPSFCSLPHWLPEIIQCNLRIRDTLVTSKLSFIQCSKVITRCLYRKVSFIRKFLFGGLTVSLLSLQTLSSLPSFPPPSLPPSLPSLQTLSSLPPFLPSLPSPSLPHSQDKSHLTAISSLQKDIMQHLPNYYHTFVDVMEFRDVTNEVVTSVATSQFFFDIVSTALQLMHTSVLQCCVLPLYV